MTAYRDTSTLLDFDPYREWLGITTRERPLNAYHLLGLSPLENLEPRIKVAAERQRVVLQRAAAGSDPALLNQVSHELEDAIATLLEPDRKAILDASLKRRSSDTRKEEPASGAAKKTGEIACPKCRQSNGAQRRFCGDCGESLWQKCGQCGTEAPADERFCGSCGGDISGLVQAQIDDIQKLLGEANELLAEHRYDAAYTRLRDVATIADPRYEQWVQPAVQLLKNLEQIKADAKAQAHQVYEKAQRYMLANSFESAMGELLGVHPNLRTSEINDLLTSAKSLRDELLALGGEIREAVANKQFSGLLSKIERLLTLKPDHASAAKLADQLRDQIHAKAQRQVGQHSYEEAVTLLRGIPKFARNQAIDDLEDKACEIACMINDIRLAPLADDATLAIAKRLIKAVASNEEAQRLHAELEKKWKTKSPNPRLPAVDAALTPRRTAVGLPVDWLGHFTRLRSDDQAVNATLAAHPGRFFVALGLALQGVDAAQVKINHLPQAKAGVLGALALPFGGKKPEAAWGLDLSASGLKAIKLSRDRKTGELKLLAAEWIPHSKALTSPEAKEEQAGIVDQTLKAFLEKHPYDKQVKVVSGISGYSVLGRFFKIPPMPAKKVDGTIEFEARAQLPIALQELAWDSHINDPVEGKGVDEQARKVLVSAVANFKLQEREARFTSAGIPLDALQCDCLALHNAIVFELFDELPQPLEGGDAICLVDVGVDSTNIVISSARAVWFRSIGQGTHDLTSAMIKQFQLTYEQATTLRCEPHRARRLYQLLELWHPSFVQISSEIGKSLDAYHKLYPEHKVARIYGLGGGFRTHGLLRQLRFGQ